MVQLTLLNGKKAGTSWSARLFPVQIGRAASCDVCCDEDGVWPQHVEISLRPADGFFAAVPADVLAFVNGTAIQEAQEARLRNGDVLELGAVKILFGLAPTRQRSFRWREALTWIALAALCLGQVGLIYWLLV